MAEDNKNQFKCSGDCLNCKPVQWQYCASQWSLNSMRMVESMQNTMNSMKGTIDELKTKIEAIQNNEANVFDPTKEENSEVPNSDTAQKGDGVEE